MSTVERLVRRSLPEHLGLEVRAPAAPLWAMVDAHQLENALLNLILNARDASPGGGLVTLQASAAPLDASAAAELQVPAGEFVRLDVSDTGSGMDAQTLARVFEPFFTTKKLGQGTGLGMAMVYGFVRQSGGAISLRSQPGQGTTVTLWLPLTEPSDEIDNPSADVPDATPGQRGLALLVEDDAAVRRVVRRTLLALYVFTYPVSAIAKPAPASSLTGAQITRSRVPGR
jgi:K+-sensing histidine kinase KdpD